MSKTPLLELISRKLAGEATAEELEEIKRILSFDHEASENGELLQRYWDQRENGNQYFVEEAFKKIQSRLDLPVAAEVVEMHTSGRRLSKRRLQYAVAAAVILFIATLIFFSGGTEIEKTALIEKQNPKGIKGSFVLPDGTKIWLNVDSKILFPKQFEGNTREVYLNGEAFFDVAKNPARPFIIHLAKGTVRVLGTSFNIRAYENEKTIETSVATGKVAFIPGNTKSRKDGDTVFLSPENKVRYLSDKGEVIVEATVSKEDRAWISGKLVFKGMTFEEIGLQLERNFGKKIVFLSGDAEMFRLTGSFQNNSLEEILFYLSKSKAFNYKITNDEVLVGDETTELPDQNN